MKADACENMFIKMYKFQNHQLVSLIMRVKKTSVYQKSITMVTTHIFTALSLISVAWVHKACPLKKEKENLKCLKGVTAPSRCVTTR